MDLDRTAQDPTDGAGAITSQRGAAMARSTPKQQYGNDSISALKGADRVRKRPGVIFGSDGLEGCEHAVFEFQQRGHGRPDPAHWSQALELQPEPERPAAAAGAVEG